MLSFSSSIPSKKETIRKERKIVQGSEKCPYGKDKEEKKNRGGGGGEMQKGKKRKMEIALFFRLLVCTFVVPCNRSKQQ